MGGGDVSQMKTVVFIQTNREKKTIDMHIVDRQTAKESGQKFFFTGRPCSRGHVAARRVVNNYCEDCRKMTQEERRRSSKIYGVGYNSTLRGEVGYPTGYGKTLAREYDHWRRMLQRSYDPKWKELHPTYEDCSVSPEWWDYQDFSHWYHKNEYKTETTDLDKDLLLVGNKEYCPELCVFIPEEINKAIVVRGNVSTWHKRDLVYEANCCGVYLGRSDNPLTHAEKWVEFKIRHINQLTDRYEDQLAPEAISALRAFTIDVLDTGEVVRVR